MVLGKLPVPGRPTYLVNSRARALVNSRARAYCACYGTGGSCFDIFTLVYHFFPLSPSLGDGPI